MIFFKNNTVKPYLVGANDFCSKSKKSVWGYQSLLPLFLFSVDSRETFLGSFYPCRLQTNKSNFFELLFRAETEPVRIFSTRPDRYISKSSPVDRSDRPVSDRAGRPVFLQKVFVYCSMYLMKNFRNGEHGWGVKICDFGRGSQKKKQKNFFFVFAKMTQF